MKVITQLAMDSELKESLKKAARNAGMLFSSFMERLLREGLERIQKKEK